METDDSSVSTDNQIDQSILDDIRLLSKTVKFSCIPGQKHLDFSLVSAVQTKAYQEALARCHKAIFEGRLKKEEFESLVGLN